MIDVVILFLHIGDRFLIGKRGLTQPQPKLWCLPGGKVEKGETFLEAILRETEEELGLSLFEDEVSHLTDLQIRGVNLQFFQSDLSEKPSIRLNRREFIEASWVTLEEAYLLPLITNGKEALDAYAQLPR